MDRVIKGFTYNGKKLRSGDMLDLSDTKNYHKMINCRIIEPVPDKVISKKSNEKGGK